MEFQTQLSSQDRQAFQHDPCLPAHPDPYSIYRALLQESPVHWCEGPQMWIVLGHPEAESIMRDPRCRREDHLDKLISKFGDERIFRRQKLDMPYMDGEMHSRARQHMMAAFHGIDIAELERFCTQVLNERLNHVRRGDWFDLMPVLANPLPVLVVSHLMGVPIDLHMEVFQQVGHFVRARGLIQTDDTASNGDAAMATFHRFFMPLIQERRRQPKDDVLTRLLVDSDGQLPLSDEQLLLIIASNFYSASIYNVPLLLSNAFRLLGQQPAVFERLREEPSLVDSAIEEFLRYDPPAQAINASVAREVIQLNGKTIPAGASLTVLVGAANRDLRVFNKPDSFLVGRNPNPHLSFAPGLHQCLGMHLVRLQMRAVLRVLLERYQTLEVDEIHSRRLVGDRFRGYEQLMVRMF